MKWKRSHPVTKDLQFQRIKTMDIYVYSNLKYQNFHMFPSPYLFISKGAYRDRKPYTNERP